MLKETHPDTRSITLRQKSDMIIKKSTMKAELCGIASIVTSPVTSDQDLLKILCIH